LRFSSAGPDTNVGQCDVLARRTVRLLSITMVEAMSIVKRMGIGSAKALHGTDLALPRTT
jgi:hypothetical protein